VSFDHGGSQNKSFVPGDAQGYLFPKYSGIGTKKTKPKAQSFPKHKQKDVFPDRPPAPREDLGPQEPGVQCCLRDLHGRGSQGHLGRREEHHFQDQVLPCLGNDKFEDGDPRHGQGDHGHLRRRRRDRRNRK